MRECATKSGLLGGPVESAAGALLTSFAEGMAYSVEQRVRHPTDYLAAVLGVPGVDVAWPVTEEYQVAGKNADIC